MRLSALTLATLVATVLALPSSAPHVEHERRSTSLRSWVKRERLHRRTELPMRIGLAQSNLDKGHDMLMDLTNHDSPNFSNWLSEEQVNELFAPSKESVNAVMDWLVNSGIAPERISQSHNKQWIQFDATPDEAEDLLKTEYHVFEHTPSGKANIACDSYHLPSHIKHHVDYITPGVKLFTTGGEQRAKEKRSLEKRIFGVGSVDPQPPLLRPLPANIQKALDADLGSSCDVAMTPQCIKALYKIPNPSKNPVKGNALGIFEDLGDVYAQEDLDAFFASQKTGIPKGTHPTLNLIDGAVAPVPLNQSGAESGLDFQISYPIVYPQEVVLYQTDDPVYENNYQFSGFLNNFLDAIDGSYCSYEAFGEKGNSPLDPVYPNPAPGGYKGKLQCGKYKPTNVISISYGGQEWDLPQNYQRRQCNEYMKLGMQGISIIISSGDSGVAGPEGDDNPNGCLGTGKQAGKIFSPDFPATCPYITALGATYLPTGADVNKGGEVAVTRFPSGGGFSNIYPIPAYQKSAVNTYLTKHKPSYPSYSTTFNQSIGANGGIYNRNGRGYPDFSAVGDNVVIYNKGHAQLIGGTSASAPAFAAVLTRINDERMKKGKKPVGFVNPTLYKHPEVFNKVTQGSNPGCGTDGFKVAPDGGWSPVTGLGTPNYEKMLKLYMSLP